MIIDLNVLIDLTFDVLIALFDKFIPRKKESRQAQKYLPAIKVF